jgi:hypothetical protein
MFVAKFNRSTKSADNSLEAYKQQMEVQSVAAYLANTFNKRTSKSTPKLKYTMVKTFTGKAPGSTEYKVRDGDIWCLEAALMRHAKLASLLDAAFEACCCKAC